MREADLELLWCPETKSDLAVADVKERSADGEILEGTLANASGDTYPIHQGIPEFVPRETYADSFGWQWNKWPRVQFDSDNVGTVMEGATEKRLTQCLTVPAEWFKDKTCVEIGCGPGRFLDVIERAGGRAVGLDLSDAVIAAKKNFAGNQNVLIVRGDALKSPLRDGAYDMAFSIGVLHHTPDPEGAFKQMARKVKSGGRTACHVYSAYDGFLIKQTAVYRAIFKVLGGRALLVYSNLSASVIYWLTKIPIIGIAVGILLPVRNFKAFSWRRLNIYDWLSPTYMSYHTTREVYDWFERAGCHEIKPTELSPTSFSATVP